MKKTVLFCINSISRVDLFQSDVNGESDEAVVTFSLRLCSDPSDGVRCFVLPRMSQVPRRRPGGRNIGTMHL